MLASVRAWLNSSRNYFSGVAILSEVGCDKSLLEVLQKGPNDFRVRRLEAQMMAIYEGLINSDSSKKIAPHADKVAENANKIASDAKKETSPVNEDLYQACKKEADLLYKKVMNDRAVLFALANDEDFLDPNMPDKVSKREKLAIAVVTGYQKVSELYDRAAYVKENGRLPNTEENIISEYDSLPDELVKQQLDNCRKAFNKLKKKEATPERVLLMQKHQINIQKLENKWRSLQAVN
jgi:hypothetical protein